MRSGSRSSWRGPREARMQQDQAREVARGEDEDLVGGHAGVKPGCRHARRSRSKPRDLWLMFSTASQMVLEVVLRSSHEGDADENVLRQHLDGERERHTLCRGYHSLGKSRATWPVGTAERREARAKGMHTNLHATTVVARSACIPRTLPILQAVSPTDPPVAERMHAHVEQRRLNSARGQ